VGKTLQAPRRRGLSSVGHRPDNVPVERPDLRSLGTSGPIPGANTPRELPAAPRISVICPTYNRLSMHEPLCSIFQSQTYPDKELWVLDDSPRPSTFFEKCADRQVHYIHSPQKQHIGAKRNQLVAMATGQVIAHFDDDDFYAANYLTSMVEALIAQDADFVKLSSWNERRLRDGHRRVFDARHQVHGNMWGWGFSFMYRRSVAAHVSFPNQNLGEDYIFVQALQARGLKTVQVDGGTEWVEHVLHGRNASRKE
jgi:glycosyltransferase involved in cell wall biosynthesis